MEYSGPGFLADIKDSWRCREGSAEGELPVEDHLTCFCFYFFNYSCCSHLSRESFCFSSSDSLCTTLSFPVSWSHKLDLLLWLFRSGKGWAYSRSRPHVGFRTGWPDCWFWHLSVSSSIFFLLLSFILLDSSSSFLEVTMEVLRLVSWTTDHTGDVMRRDDVTPKWGSDEHRESILLFQEQPLLVPTKLLWSPT